MVAIIAPVARGAFNNVGMGGDDWLIIYGGSSLFMLIRLA